MQKMAIILDLWRSAYYDKLLNIKRRGVQKGLD
jgi:hypothetical protein